MECQEADITQPLSPDGQVPPAWSRYNQLLQEASMLCGRRLDVTPLLMDYMREVGFVDVEEVVYPVPHGPWHKDRHMKEIGKWSLDIFNIGTEAFALAPFTRVLGMDLKEVERIVEEARHEMLDFRKVKFYINT